MVAGAGPAARRPRGERARRAPRGAPTAPNHLGAKASMLSVTVPEPPGRVKNMPCTCLQRTRWRLSSTSLSSRRRRAPAPDAPAAAWRAWRMAHGAPPQTSRLPPSLDDGGRRRGHALPPSHRAPPPGQRQAAEAAGAEDEGRQDGRRRRQSGGPRAQGVHESHDDGPAGGGAPASPFAPRARARVSASRVCMQRFSAPRVMQAASTAHVVVLPPPPAPPKGDQAPGGGGACGARGAGRL